MKQNIMTRIRKWFYNPNMWKYDEEKPVRIVPADRIESLDDLAEVMVSVDRTNAQWLEKLEEEERTRNLRYVELDGLLEYKEGTEIRRSVGTRGGISEAAFNVINARVYCGEYYVNISDILFHTFSLENRILKCYSHHSWERHVPSATKAKVEWIKESFQDSGKEAHPFGGEWHMVRYGAEIRVQGVMYKDINSKMAFRVYALEIKEPSTANGYYTSSVYYSAKKGHICGDFHSIEGDSIWKHTIRSDYEHRVK